MALSRSSLILLLVAMLFAAPSRAVVAMAGAPDCNGTIVGGGPFLVHLTPGAMNVYPWNVNSIAANCPQVVTHQFVNKVCYKPQDGTPWASATNVLCTTYPSTGSKTGNQSSATGLTSGTTYLVRGQVKDLYTGAETPLSAYQSGADGACVVTIP